MTKDTLTTIIGAIGAGLLAVEPALHGVSTETLQSGDWKQLVGAIVVGLLGYFTNKHDVVNAEKVSDK